MTATINSDVEQQQSPGRHRRGGGLDSLQGESMNFSAYLNAQRHLKSQRFLQRRTSVRNLRLPSDMAEEGTEDEEQNNDGSKKSRQFHRLSSSEWDDIFDDLGNIDENGQFHDEHAHMKPFYAAPVQRQRWGEDQVLPHVNWGEFVGVF